MAYVSIIVDSPLSIGRETKRAVNSIPMGRRGIRPEIYGNRIKAGMLYASQVAEALVRKGKTFRAIILDPKSSGGNQDITYKLITRAKGKIEHEGTSGVKNVDVVFQADLLQAQVAIPQRDVVFQSLREGAIRVFSPSEQEYHNNLALFDENTAIALNDALTRVASAVNYAGKKKERDKLRPWDLVSFTQTDNGDGSVVGVSLPGIEKAFPSLDMAIWEQVDTFVRGGDIDSTERRLNDVISNLIVDGHALGAVYSLALPRLGTNKTSSIIQ